jgi:transcription elongation factor GreB
MSKAFTKEDDVGELPALPRLVSPLTPGTKNYLTAAGSRELHGELTYLREAKRPPLVAAAQQSGEAREDLQSVDQRIAYLEESLRSAEVVPLPNAEDDRVRFGATVTVKDLSSDKTDYRIVGVDETNLDRNWVSWQSPIARALLNARLGDRVMFKFPSGQTELEIVKIRYE